MPKQNFISKEFFVAACEKQTQQVLLMLPEFISNITLLERSTTVFSTKFIYESEGSQDQYVVISLLPLNHQYTNVILHVSYVSGVVFHKDAAINNTVINIESAMQSAVAGTLSNFQLQKLSKNRYKRLLQLMLPSLFWLAPPYLVKTILAKSIT